MDDAGKARVQTNPLTWSQAGGGQHLGAKVPGNDQPVVPPEGYGNSVTVTDKAVWVDDPRPWYSKCGPAASGGNLHPVDIQFWFFNIRENVPKRLQAFFELRNAGKLDP